MPEFFVPHDDERRPASSSMFVVVRVTGDPASLAVPLRSALSAIDSSLAVADLRTLAERVSLTLGQRQYQLFLLVVFGAVALGLAAVGAYGVLAFVVGLRTREIGLRLALGARAGDLFVMVIRDGMRLAGLGIGAGLIAAFALTRFQQPLLYEVSPTDPLTFGAVSVILAGVAFAASAIPAWRAMHVEAMTAMRSE
jgi:ABC-type antimicrobial peptide transport system permease subunit